MEEDPAYASINTSTEARIRDVEEHPAYGVSVATQSTT